MDNTPDYTVDLTIEDIRLMHQCIEYRIKYWEGSPARPPEEQEHLWKVRVGRFHEKNYAEKCMDKLKNIGFSDCWVVETGQQ